MMERAGSPRNEKMDKTPQTETGTENPSGRERDEKRIEILAKRVCGSSNTVFHHRQAL